MKKLRCILSLTVVVIIFSLVAVPVAALAQEEEPVGSIGLDVIGDRGNVTIGPGEERVLTVLVSNTGGTAVGEITLVADPLFGWEVEVQPDKIQGLDVGTTYTANVTIRPPVGTPSGDYLLLLNASAESTQVKTVYISVMVKAPSIWPWVGLGVVLAVAIGLLVIFLRYRRH